MSLKRLRIRQKTRIGCWSLSTERSARRRRLKITGFIVPNIGGELRAFVLAHDPGRVGVEIPHRSPYDAYNARIPDISFTSKARLSDVVTRGSVPQLPDLAVEVKSRDDSYLQMRAKAAWFLAAAGCHLQVGLTVSLIRMAAQRWG
ncbi:hypothetical protein FBR02_08030 [Anaerolineae bacterium CFX9]|nr:hypothetical protein [Anaerolineae bacterium CFX9]